jgi:hypothetical protein
LRSSTIDAVPSAPSAPSSSSAFAWSASTTISRRASNALSVSAARAAAASGAVWIDGATNVRGVARGFSKIVASWPLKTRRSGRSAGSR